MTSDLPADALEAQFTVRTAQDAFTIYRTHVMPRAAGVAQVLETKRAFYAGIEWGLGRLMAATGTDADDGEQLGRQILEELQQFAGAQLEPGGGMTDEEKRPPAMRKGGLARPERENLADEGGEG